MKVWVLSFIDERGATTLNTIVCSTHKKAISALNDLVDDLVQSARITKTCGQYIKSFYSKWEKDYLNKLMFPLVDGQIKIQEIEVL